MVLCPRRASWQLIVAFFFANMAYFGFVVYWWMRHPGAVITSISSGSIGLINQVFMLFAVPMIFLVGGLLFAIAGYRPQDIGLQKRGMALGLGIAFLLWVVAQGAHAANSLATGIDLGFSGRWMGTANILDSIGDYLSLYAGNALYEEVVFRGFLLIQILGRILDSGKWSQRTSIVIAVLSSQMLFAVVHLPSDLMTKHPYGLFSEQFLFGILLALIYLMSRNLWICIGLHALLNGPPALFNTSLLPATAGLISLVCAITITSWTRNGRAWLAEIRESPSYSGFSVEAPMGS